MGAVSEAKYDFYLAGPFFNDQQKATMDSAKEVLQTFGLVICDPRDLSPVLVDMDPGSRGEWAAEVYRRNIDAMEDSFGIIACIDDRDTGTSYELGYMSAQRRWQDQEDIWSGPIITFSGFGHGANVMLSQATDLHFPTITDMIAGFNTCITALREAHHDPKVTMFGWGMWFGEIMGKRSGQHLETTE